MKNNTLTLKHNPQQAQLIGYLNFSTVLKILDTGLQYVASADEPSFDFSEIKKANSAGIALMLAWWRAARQLKKTIHWQNIPKNMLALITVCDLEKILEVPV